MTQRPDDDLHAPFQAERAAERRRAPTYIDVVVGRRSLPRRAARGVRWLLLSGALATVVGGFWLAGQARSARELELARRVMVSSSPTAFLLQVPRLSLVDSLPRLGKSVPGSPLRALDPGGPLGPPLTRSPRL